jgi:hypothetical protein
MAISVAQAKSLCTAREFALVKASTRDEVGKSSASQLQQNITLARNLRDKWHDQSRDQRRATQAGQRSRQTDGHARSGEKAELFGETLARFESRLTTLEPKGKSGGRAPKRMPPRVRSAAHRATRTEVRGEMRQVRLELGGQTKRRKTKSQNPTKAAVAAASVEPTADATTVPSKGIDKPKVATGSAGRSKKSSAAISLTVGASQGLRVGKGKQLRAHGRQTKPAQSQRDHPHSEEFIGGQ